MAAAGALLAPACASIGRPEGGARDTEPPVFVSARPAPGATGVKSTRLSILFDENIQLDDAFNKVIVSPVQSTPPSVSANGRRLSVELRDTLVTPATYTIDFGDAIKDLNEGNVLDGFAIDFSTGSAIDSLRISGMVLAAENLEPAQGMLVGVYRADSVADSTVRTLPFERVARTNQLGQFTVRGLAPGTYRIYAVNDINRAYHWDRSEDIAFYDIDIRPSVEDIEVTDTLRSSLGTDSVVTHPGLRYLPNDILLTWFNENYRAQYLKDYARPTRRTITLGFGASCDSLPRLTIVNDTTAASRRIIPRDGWNLLQINPGRDSLTYWLTETTKKPTNRPPTASQPIAQPQPCPSHSCPCAPSPAPHRSSTIRCASSSTSPSPHSTPPPYACPSTKTPSSSPCRHRACSPTASTCCAASSRSTGRPEPNTPSP